MPPSLPGPRYACRSRRARSQPTSRPPRNLQPRPWSSPSTDGIIHPITAEFVEDVIARADRTGAVAIVLVLRTPGGLLDSTRTIVSRIVASRAPVVVFIAPPGSRAASAGFLITLAADVAVMAPGTHIGAAHPVTPGGETPGGEVMSQKVAADAAAYARTIAEARRRNAALAAEAVTESRAFTDGEALHADPPLDRLHRARR